VSAGPASALVTGASGTVILLQNLPLGRSAAVRGDLCSISTIGDVALTQLRGNPR